MGAKYKQKFAGTFGLAGCLSFYPTKSLGAFGDAGAVITNNKEFAEKIRAIRNHGRSSGTDISFWGLNCRMDTLNAAILDFKLTKLPEWIKRRREIAKIYNDRLIGLKELKLPLSPEVKSDYYNVFQNYELEAEKRNELVDFLNINGIEVMLPWGGKGVHQITALGQNKFILPRTDDFFKKVLILPIYPELDNKQVKYIADMIKKFYLH
ncbi:DegT/DnrJ/EryC1/StrS family aminotransferase [Candidatus Desantisbacteria bacterium]|nr:DegT/DnrJ/EryC1/StrS family aminotransferase [Candidatus Desantisbacteria bacterium]